MPIELEKAIDIIRSSATRLESEEVLVIDAIGRLLSEDISAMIDQPPFHRSPLDGYAIKANDSIGATKESPVSLNVVDIVFAGEQSNRVVGPREAIRIMTGSPLPEGCDCVIRQEDTQRELETVLIHEAVKPFQNYCFKGEDFKSGEVLLKTGMKLDAIGLAVCASAGLVRLKVVRKPKVAVISTGDELLKPGEQLTAGKIYNANFTYLITRLKQLGMDISGATVVGDSLAQISEQIHIAAKLSDFIITTGGVSVGEKDLIYEATQKLGAVTRFHGIAMKPGSPAMFSMINNIPMLSLSGNPFACISTFELLARPILYEMNGDHDLLLKDRSAQLINEFPKASPKRRFIRGVFNNGEIELPKGNSSGKLRSMIGCNCLVDIQAGTGPIEKGTIVSVKIL